MTYSTYVSNWGQLLSMILVLTCPCSATITDPASTTVLGVGLDPLQTAGVPGAFTITSRDASGVARTSGGDRYLVELIGNSHVISEPLDELDGTNSVSYTVTRSGRYTMETGLFREGGLTAQYYENVWFFFSPVATRIDSGVDFEWGLDRLTQQASDFVSIRWKGKVGM